MLSKEEMKSHYSMCKNTPDGGFDCLCNCHNDHHPSFHWKIGNKGWIGRCKTCGATGAESARMAGINVFDLFMDAEPRSQRISRTQYGYEKNCIGKYPYFRIDNGLQTHIKYRLKPFEDGRKNIKQGYDKNGEWINTLKDIDTSLSVFCNVSIEKLNQTVIQDKRIFHFEGEEDTKTGGKYGLVGFTIGGTTEFEKKKQVFKYIKDAMLIIFGDNDDVGKKCAEKIRSYYEELGGKAVIIIPSDIQGGDISDFMQNHTRADLKKLIDDALNQNTVTENRRDVAEHDTRSRNPCKKDQIKNIVSLLIKYQAAQKYSTTDKGSGALFADVFMDKHRYNPEWRDFAYYDGKRWIKDIEGMKARTSAKMLVDALLQYTAQAGLDEKAQSSYFKFVYQLSQLKNRNAMLNDAKDKYCFCNS